MIYWEVFLENFNGRGVGKGRVINCFSLFVIKKYLECGIFSVRISIVLGKLG